jgi:hypothetical protein
LEYEDATFCDKCEKSLVLKETESQQDVIKTPQRQNDLLFSASILTIIAATFVASLGYLGVYQHFAAIDYYINYYGLSSSAASELALGFLILGIISLIAGAFALVGAFFMLKRKLFILSMLGTVFPLTSVFITLIIVQQYGYGFTDILIFAEIAAAIFSFITIFMNFASRREYK